MRLEDIALSEDIVPEEEAEKKTEIEAEDINNLPGDSGEESTVKKEMLPEILEDTGDIPEGGDESVSVKGNEDLLQEVTPGGENTTENVTEIELPITAVEASGPENDSDETKAEAVDASITEVVKIVPVPGLTDYLLATDTPLTHELPPPRTFSDHEGRALGSNTEYAGEINIDAMSDPMVESKTKDTELMIGDPTEETELNSSTISEPADLFVSDDDYFEKTTVDTVEVTERRRRNSGSPADEILEHIPSFTTDEVSSIGSAAETDMKAEIIKDVFEEDEFFAKASISEPNHDNENDGHFDDSIRSIPEVGIEENGDSMSVSISSESGEERNILTDNDSSAQLVSNFESPIRT